MFAPSGLDAGLLVGTEHVIAWPQCGAMPAPLVGAFGRDRNPDLPCGRNSDRVGRSMCDAARDRRASWLSQRQTVVPLILATMPLAMAF